MLLALAFLSVTTSHSQDEFFALIAQNPNADYDYPGFICPHYNSYFVEPTISNLGLLGKVKKVEYADGTLLEFNSKGKITKQVQVFDSSPGSRTTLYKYNDQNQLIFMSSKSEGFSDASFQKHLEYSKTGIITQTFIRDEDTTITKITEDQIYNSRRSVTRNSMGLIVKSGESTYEYDGRKRLIKIKSSGSVENRYYNENNTLSRIEYKEKNKETYVSFRYDPKGKWIREKSTKVVFGNSRVNIDNLITLEFDSKGNWTTMDIKDNKDSRFSKKHTRVITYY